MDDNIDEAAAAPSQELGWSSYSLSIPSPPPDIRNWFASYEYESPEVPELDAYRGGHNCSETQDPLEHSISPRNDGVARCGGQSENEFFDRKEDLVPVDESIVKKPPKRKQSLRALFGFLDKREEATESECQVASPVERNGLEPQSICNATGLFDAKRSEECGNMPVDCNGISSLDTQISSPADEEVKYSKLSVTCVGSSLADNQKCFQKAGIDSIDHGKEPVDCEGISSAETQVSSPADQELEYSSKLRSVICDSSRLADIQKCLPEDSTDNIKHSKVSVDCDGISSVDTQVSSPADQEVEYSKLPVTCDVSGLVDTQKFFQEDGSDEMPINIFGTNLTKTEKDSRDGAEHRMLPVCHDRVILADTRENSAVEENGHCKPALDNKGQEQTVSSDGFIAIKRKHKPPEERKTNRIKHPRGTDKAPLQEDHDMLGRKVLARVHTRSPLADKTNFPEAAAAAAKVEPCGKWKCPTKGKPHVGPPMKQLRLEQWLRPVRE